MDIYRNINIFELFSTHYLVKGFGETKVGKYGENIIQIIEKYDRIK